MLNKAILCIICSWSHRSLHVYSLVGGLVPGSSRGLLGWYYCSSHRVANFFSSFSPFSNFSIGDTIRDTVLSPVVGCEPLPLCLSDSGRASQETSISCFCQQTSLALTILSGFGDSIRDGSLGGAVYGYPFLQFLLHTMSPYCSHAYFVPPSKKD